TGRMGGGAVRAARLLVFLVLIPCSAPAASLRDQLRASSLTVGIAGGSAFDALADNIADTAARNLPIISASAGYTYRYNPQLEIFERTSETLGPLFLERPSNGITRGNAVGVGDILLRAKYQFAEQNGLRSAAGLQLRLPSGNQDDFQGTGDFEASPFLYLSTVLWSRVEPHANLGIDLRTDDVERSQARYGLGADVDVTKRIGASVPFPRRSQFKAGRAASHTHFLPLTAAGVQ